MPCLKFNTYKTILQFTFLLILYSPRAIEKLIKQLHTIEMYTILKINLKIRTEILDLGFHILWAGMFKLGDLNHFSYEGLLRKKCWKVSEHWIQYFMTVRLECYYKGLLFFFFANDLVIFLASTPHRCQWWFLSTNLGESPEHSWISPPGEKQTNTIQVTITRITSEAAKKA